MQTFSLQTSLLDQGLDLEDLSDFTKRLAFYCDFVCT